MSECTKIQESVIDYLAASLSPDEQGSFDGHLEACEVCRETVRSYREISGAYRESHTDDISPAIADRILSMANPPVARAVVLRWLGIATAAAAVLLLFLFKGSRELANSDPSDPVVERIALGDEHRSRGELRQALSAYEEAEALAEATAEATAEAMAETHALESALVHHRLGATLLALGEHARALEHLEVVQVSFPDYPDRDAILFLKGESLVALGELDRARQAYQLITRDFPEHRLEAETHLRELPAMTSDILDRLRALGYVE